MEGAERTERSVARSSSNPGLTRQGKLKRHCWRWWWAYTIAVFSMMVIMTIIPMLVCCAMESSAVLKWSSLYVTFPREAQDTINDADLVVTSQAILSPAADNFYLEQSIVFVTSSGESASLDEWTASFCLDQQCEYPFAEIDVPKSQAENDTRIQVSQGIQITNTSEFNTYTRLGLGSEEYSFFLTGQGRLHKGAWPPATVHYNKNITMKGLNALKGFNMTAFHILNPPLADGTNANGTILIPNPSVSSYEMGDLTLNLSVDRIPIGTAFLQNVFLGPGNNSFLITAITNLTAVAGLVQERYETGVLPVDVVGSSVLYNGQHLPWYEQAFGALPLRVDLNIMPALQEAGSAGLLGLGDPSTTA